MEPKNYSTIRSILKKEQGEKIAPYIFKINDTQTPETYLRQGWHDGLMDQWTLARWNLVYCCKCLNNYLKLFKNIQIFI